MLTFGVLSTDKLRRRISGLGFAKTQQMDIMQRAISTMQVFILFLSPDTFMNVWSLTMFVLPSAFLYTGITHKRTPKFAEKLSPLSIPLSILYPISLSVDLPVSPLRNLHQSLSPFSSTTVAEKTVLKLIVGLHHDSR